MMALGALGIVGGGVCLAWGLPYLVLEQGFTYAIIGSVLITGGVILISLGLLLRELRTIAGRIGGFSAQDAAAAIAAGAVAAGSAVAAGIVAGKSAVEEPKFSGRDDAQGELALDAAPEPALAQDTGPVVPEAGPEPVPSADAAQPQDEGPEPEPTLPKVPAFPSFDELPPPTRGEDASTAPGSEPAPPLPPAPSDEEDPFERLRRSLMLGEKPVRADALAAGMTSGVASDAPAPLVTPHGDVREEPAPQDDAAAESATPEPEDHAEAVIAEAAAVIAPETGDEADDGPRPDRADPDPRESDTRESDTREPEAREPEAGEPEPETSPAPEGPAISEEGIVSVRRIGDSTYTMYADGSVKAETPDTVLHFATVAELKAHLTNPMR
jgi:hypothetical protein